ncbi:MAG: MFS transporter [Deltaproteobacteria bacterium]|nr:MAG: MFS transporter [Deltaproteobacteria bacterium]
MIGRLRWIYFLAYAGVGTWLSYFAPYLRGLGFSGEEIGAVTTVQQLAAAPAALLWGSIGDRLGSVRALRICVAGAAVAVSFLLLARTPWQMGLVLLFAASFAGGLVPLVDSTTVEAVRRSPEHSYARTRLWGSIGFVLSAQGLGLLLSGRGDRPADPVMPLAYLGCVVGYAILAQTLPPIEAHPDRPHWRDAVALLRSPQLLFLLFICALHWGACGPYHLMYGVLVRDLGLPSSITGLGMALGVACEVVALLVFPWLERRFSLRALFAVAFAGTALRWALLSRAESAAAVVALQLFHALTFGLWWGCAIGGMSRTVPPRLRATGQALFSAVVFGAGQATGYVLSGIGYDRFGGVPPLYAWAAAVEVLPLVLLLAPLTPEKGGA